MNQSETAAQVDFVRAIIKEDLASGKHAAIQTRFPPEPNGYLHIGHAKAIHLNFSVAEEFGGLCNLRFDDTNPIKEEQEFVDGIQADIRWLGYDWGDRLYFASDYFEQLYNFAIQLIKMEKAYVCDLSPEQMRAYRGTLTEPGEDSPYRNRTVAENLDLFTRMRAGEFPDGSRTLRAKIDMAAGNLNMRDPVIYRILRAHHHRTGDAWCIYPMYDFTHCLSDSLERVTHSLCSIEFVDHRPLYDWYLETLGVFPSKQYEFARMNMTYTVLSKRRLRQLVEEGHVAGWDDPRMPTLKGMRRRGYTPAAIRDFLGRIGLAKRENTVDLALLEFCLREDLNRHAQRAMAVLNPLKVVITNYPTGQSEELDCVNNPEDESAGTRKVPFSSEIYIERDDFMEEPPKKFFRLAPGREVRLRYAYFITCDEVVKDPASGEVTELRCRYDPASRGGNSPDGRKVKATLHWVSAQHAREAEVRLYDHLFTQENPQDVPAGGSFADTIHAESLKTLSGCRVEPFLAGARAGEFLQFERQGYFCIDAIDSRPDALVFNRTVTLRDTWAKIQKSLTSP